MRKKLSLSKVKESERRFAVRSSKGYERGERVQIVGLDKRKFLAEFYNALNFVSLFQDKEINKNFII